MGKMTSSHARAKKIMERTQCSVGVFARSLGPEEDAEFREILDDHSISARAIATVIRDEYEVALSWSQVLKHRRGDCRCP